MTAKKLKKFQDLLIEEKRNTLDDLLKENESYESLKESAMNGDIADIAFQSYEKQLLIGLSQKEKDKIDRIDAALQRIEAGTYGKCVDCGIDLDEERLTALPWALRCVSCKNKNEDELRKKGLPVR